MKKEEFEMQYCTNSEITIEEYNENFITLPCNCNAKDCLGWACICNNELSIKNHKKLNPQ